MIINFLKTILFCARYPFTRLLYSTLALSVLLTTLMFLGFAINGGFSQAHVKMVEQLFHLGLFFFIVTTMFVMQVFYIFAYRETLRDSDITLTTSSNNALFGARGAATGVGRGIAAVFEAGMAGSGSLVNNSSQQASNGGGTPLATGK